MDPGVEHLLALTRKISKTDETLPISWNACTISRKYGSRISVSKSSIIGSNDLRALDASTLIDRTPVMISCEKGYPEDLSILLQAGLDMTRTDMRRYDALTYAVLNGNFECCKLLVEYGVCSCNQNSLLNVCLNMDQLFYEPWNKECTNEMILKCISIVIEATLDINLQNECDFTALMAASSTGNLNVMEQLINAGADVNLQNMDGQNALIVCILNSGVNIGPHLKLLIKSGSNVNHRDKHGYSALKHIYRNISYEREWSAILVRAGALMDDVPMVCEDLYTFSYLRSV